MGKGNKQSMFCEIVTEENKVIRKGFPELLPEECHHKNRLQHWEIQENVVNSSFLWIMGSFMYIWIMPLFHTQFFLPLYFLFWPTNSLKLFSENLRRYTLKWSSWLGRICLYSECWHDELSKVLATLGGGIRMGNTCKPMAVSFQYMTKSTTIKKRKKKC